ncbi:hypothetical protein ACQP25_32765 [Microtetraspora malaysiensis]|uniref:hypothetical protein n=1 Tax=Microtetraspora malaysiensis TaxID=161358 RepID=UPI003D949304
MTHPLRRYLPTILLAAMALPAVTSGCSAVGRLSGLDCINDPTRSMAERAQKESILDKIPPGAHDASDMIPTLACTDANGIGEVDRLIKFDGTPFDVASYYASEAKLSGWRMTKDGTRELKRKVGTADYWPSDTCYSKDLGGFVADLVVAFDYWSGDSSGNPSPPQYWLQISFSPTGGNCKNGVDIDY